MKNDSLANKILNVLTTSSKERVLAKQDNKSLTLGEVLDKFAELDKTFSGLNLSNKIISLVIDDPFDYLIFDLYLIKEQAVNLTVPQEFSDEQLASFLGSADLCIVQTSQNISRILNIREDLLIVNTQGSVLHNAANNDQPVAQVTSWCKVVHTSGTTSNPKGAIISRDSLANMIAKLEVTIDINRPINYYSFQPLSLLIEQVFSIYLPLVTGGIVYFKSNKLSVFGLSQSVSTPYFDELIKLDCNFFFFPPKVIEDLAKYCHQENVQDSLFSKGNFCSQSTFLLTGGGRVNSHAITTLKDLGITVFEGYGTSENCSVISMNNNTAHKTSTAGKLLPNTIATIDNGEILIKSNSIYEGYLKSGSFVAFNQEEWFRTGDLGEIDEEGFLKVRGRKKNLIILSSARNICPEHIESVYRRAKFVESIVVFGDSKPFLTAVVYVQDEVCLEKLNQQLNQLSNDLPEYSKLKDYIIAPIAEHINHFTVTNRPRREAIFNTFHQELNQLYL